MKLIIESNIFPECFVHVLETYPQEYMLIPTFPIYYVNDSFHVKQNASMIEPKKLLIIT